MQKLKSNTNSNPKEGEATINKSTTISNSTGKIYRV